MAISTIAEIEHLHNVHSGSPQTTQRNPPQITKIYSMIFKQQLTDISTVLNNTGNTTKLLTSFNALDIAQQKVLLSSSLLSEKQKEQCITMATLSAANTKYTAEQLAKATGISTETLANWGLIESTDALTISELAQRAASDAQAKAVLDKIIAQNAEAVANGKIIASNTALTASEGGATLATGAFTTAIKANIKAMITWMTTTPLGWLTMLVGGVFLAVKAYDALTVSVKEQKEKMEDSLSAYKDAKSELSNITTELENQEQAMDDLLAKEKLTYAEQGQLEELQAITRELRIQKDLAEKEEGRTQKEVAKDASDLFSKQFGKYDISEDAISEYQNNANITGNNAILISDENDISSMIAGYRQFNDLLDEAYGSENQEDIDHFKSLTEGLKDSIFETAQELQEQQSNIADYYNTIKDIPYDDLTTEQKGIVDSYNSISDAIELIYQQLDSNTWKSMQIESVFDTDGIEKTKEELIEMVKAGEFDESTLQSYPKLSAALEQNKVSASELRNELEALADAEGNVKGDTFNDKYPISFEDAWADSFTSENDKVKELGDTLLDLAENGRLTKEAFKEADSTAGDYFKNLGISADEAVSKINKLVDESKQLSSMSDQISSMAEALGTKLEDGFVSADTLSGFDVEVRGLESWDRFQSVLGSTTSSYEECQEAANALATEWINSSDFLAQLTEQNEEYYRTQLKAMGIENYDEVISYAHSLNEAKEVLSQSSLELGNATYDEIEALIAEGQYSELTADMILALYDAKIAEQAVTLDTAADCENLIALAGDTDRTSRSIQLLIQLMNIYNQLESGAYENNAVVRGGALAAAVAIKSQLETIANSEVKNMEIEPTVKLGSKGKSDAKKSGRKTADAYLEAFEKELEKLQGMRDRNEITEKEYLDRLRVA